MITQMTEQQQIDFVAMCKRVEEHPWLTIDDVSKELGVSKRTIHTCLSNGDLTSSKWKNRTLIKSVSIISFLLKKKLIEMSDVSEKIDVRDRFTERIKE